MSFLRSDWLIQLHNDFLAVSTGFIGLPQWLSSKESACNAGDTGSSLGWEDPLKEGTATHSSILAWRILWTEEPGRAIVHRVAKSWTGLKRLSTHDHTDVIGRRCDYSSDFKTE